MPPRMLGLKPTVLSDRMLTELENRWPLLTRHGIARQALERGLNSLLGVPTLMPADLAQAIKRGIYP
jgi:hypothetical protein